MKVAIDAGHGGRDSGAVANGVREKDVTLVYAQALSEELRRRGVPIVVTREEDVDLAPDCTNWKEAAGNPRPYSGKSMDLQRRCERANASGATVFVSIHANAGASMRANGAWVLYAKGSEKGRHLAAIVFEEIARIPEVADADPDREVYADDSPSTDGRSIYVLHHTSMPAILVELGFLTNTADVAQLAAPATVYDICRAIANGIESWAHP